MPLLSADTCLGVEFGSTRIKAVQIDGDHRPVDAAGYTWKSDYIDGLWTYDLDEALAGLQAAVAGLSAPERVAAMGVSGMMHGYLAFDKDWKLLTPFRTWQNTVTGEAAEALTAAFGFNIPQRWSIAHLYQAVLNGERHVPDIAHLTTLAGYVHFRLTGVNAVGVGEASGMFPIDSDALDYHAAMLDRFDELTAKYNLPWRVHALLPKVLAAGDAAGCLTPEGARLLGGRIQAGVPLCPAEGDAGTGMVATNAVAPRTGNVSAGTSIFSMVVLEKPLLRVYPELDMVTTPAGSPVAMVHCNNCTNDMNAWASVFSEAAALFGAEPETDALYTRLYEASLSGDPDCGGVLVCNYLAGEGVTHLDAGRPLVLRGPDSRFTLSNLLRASLYATVATLRLGMELLEEEQVAIDTLTGHGGLFKTPLVGQRYLAAALCTPVTCMETAGEGGAYGIALLAAYMARKKPGEALTDYLNESVFQNAVRTTLAPDPADVAGFGTYLARFRRLLDVERAATMYMQEEQQ